ncbi:DUF3150 domain-containing protein (plasmid) [Psychrobium sp. nBUS_13]|uniref:DUF3150 domain-containing protein n=1 Tax=Psychrobium sp. nBUS_13 TaxID=3395319 RepID=UPI003EC0330C
MNDTTTTTTTKNQAIDHASALIERNTALKEGCCLLGAKVSSPCGESTLPNAVVSLGGQKINSEQVKSSKLQWFPRSHLKLTTKYSNSISRILNAAGVKLGEMTVVPLSKLDKVQDELNALKDKWQSEVDEVITDYDVIIAQHCLDNPDVAHLIRAHAIPASEFKTRFKMRLLTPLALTPLNEEDDSALADELGDNLWAEIAKEASKIYSASWFNNSKPVTRVSQKIRRPINRVVDKILDLSFLDESLVTVATSITDVMRQLPASGYIEGREFDNLTKWMFVMSDESKLRLHAENSANANAYLDSEDGQKAVSHAEQFIDASTEQFGNVDQVTTIDTEDVTPEIETQFESPIEVVQQPSTLSTTNELSFGNW